MNRIYIKKYKKWSDLSEQSNKNGAATENVE